MIWQKITLGAVDYAIITVTLMISTAIGFYFRFSRRYKATIEEFLLAGRDMAVLPVAVSLMATLMSTTTLMGIPAEIYLYGTHMAFQSIGHFFGILIAAYAFIPVYFDTGSSTCYEYLEERFGKTTRRIFSVLFLVNMVLYSGLVLYAPYLALNAVINLSFWMATISVGAVCTLYCSLAGVKAVLWADVFQATLMFACVFTVIIKGTLDMGSITNVFRIANDGGRLLISSFTLDTDERYTMLNVVLQGTATCVWLFGCSQLQVQRILTLKNVSRSKMAIFLSIPFVISFYLLCCVCGLVIYAYFQSCDPLTSDDKPIHSADQLLPFYISSTMSQYPGLTGFCISGIFSASLSSVSSAINCLTAVTWEDLVHPLCPNLRHPVSITKAFSVFYGVTCVAIAYFVGSLGNLIKTNIILHGMTLGPALSTFFLGMFTRTANEEGVILGMVVGSVSIFCVSVFSPRRIDPQLPVSNKHFTTWIYGKESVNNSSLIMGAEILNFTRNSTASSLNIPNVPLSTKNDFPLSYMWLSPLGFLISLVVGYVGSVIIGCFQGTRREVNPLHLSPIRRWLLERSSKWLRGKKGQNHDTKL